MSSDKFALNLSVVRRTRNLWDDQSEQLRGGHKRLTDAKNAVDALGDRVSPVATTYLNTWLTQVENHAADAQSHADALATFSTSIVHLDSDAAAEIRASLAWADRYDAVEHVPDGGQPSFPTDDPGPSPEPSPSPGPTP